LNLGCPGNVRNDKGLRGLDHAAPTSILIVIQLNFKLNFLTPVQILVHMFSFFNMCWIFFNH
jgi:hypothetical protein